MYLLSFSSHLKDAPVVTSPSSSDSVITMYALSVTAANRHDAKMVYLKQFLESVSEMNITRLRLIFIVEPDKVFEFDMKPGTHGYTREVHMQKGKESVNVPVEYYVGGHPWSGQQASRYSELMQV